MARRKLSAGNDSGEYIHFARLARDVDRAIKRAVKAERKKFCDLMVSVAGTQTFSPTTTSVKLKRGKRGLPR